MVEIIKMLAITPVLRYFHPCFPEKNLKKRPIKITIDGTPIVIFRDSEGQPAALLDRCPHRFTPLSAGWVEKGRITCPYHGWNFDKGGLGKTPSDPQQKNVCKIASFRVIEKKGYLWIANKNVAEEPKIDDEGWNYIGSIKYKSPAPLHVVLDNFNEDEHFPFVHKILGWDAEGAQHIKHDFSVKDGEMHVNYSGPQRKFFGMRLIGFSPKSVFRMRWTMKFNPIHASYVARFTDSNNEEDDVSITHSKATIYFVPIDNCNTAIHVFLYYRPIKPWSKFMMLMTKRLFLYMARKDLQSDVILHKKISHVPYDFKGMALGSFDQPLKYSRKLLEEVYYSSSSKMKRFDSK